MLTERLRRALERASDLPQPIQDDIAEQIEEMLAFPPLPPESISIHHLIGDDGSDAFFESMMDELVDILPRLESGGFRGLLPGSSCFTGSRLSGLGPARSYTLSTGKHRQPGG